MTPDELSWMLAISEWRQRSSPRYADKIADIIIEMDIPDFAKTFLIDLASGTVEPLHKGRPPLRTGQEERTLIFETLAEWDALKRRHEPAPKDTAIARVAERYGVTEDALRGIMESARASGLTLGFWQKHIGPSTPMDE